jgi:hypothetical protein
MHKNMVTIKFDEHKYMSRSRGVQGPLINIVGNGYSEANLGTDLRSSQKLARQQILF